MLLKRQASMILLLIFLIGISNISYGNAAEPPSVMIIVPNPPEGLEISIGKDDTYTKSKEIDKVVEKYYIFYSREIEKASNNRINVKIEDLSFEIEIGDLENKYQNIYTLNLESKTLSPGKSLSRSIILVSMRIIITLIIEGVVFFLFGFRNKRSWIIFILINLLTQGVLNTWINGLFPIQSYLLIGLIFLELIILLVEVTVILSSIKEHKKSRRLLFVISANFLSLVAGGYILTVLPF